MATHLTSLGSFVIVWDKANADRRGIQQCDLVPPFCTFAGECMDPKSSVLPLVQGNGFACLAHSVEEVQHKMRTSVYNKQVNLKSVAIGQLEHARAN